MLTIHNKKEMLGSHIQKPNIMFNEVFKMKKQEIIDELYSIADSCHILGYNKETIQRDIRQLAHRIKYENLTKHNIRKIQ